jgi:DNA-binding NarL/FixJ family response regulator
MIRVLVVDDHAIVRDGLRRLLESADDIDLVATAADGTEALAAADRLEVDVALMDLSMPGMDGVEATRRLSEIRPGVRVVVLTTFSDQRRIISAIRSGAAGYLLKDASPDEILAGIRTVFAGGAPLHPKAARVLLETHRAPQPAHELTAREQQVLALVGRGLANKHIARQLGITERTVKAHLTSIFQQLNVTDRTQAALWVRDHPATE